MARYIDADVARRIIDSPRSKEQMLLVLSQVEPADVAKVVHGEWKDGYKRQSCSVCNYRGMRSWNYCPYCGTRMDGGR